MKQVRTKVRILLCFTIWLLFVPRTIAQKPPIAPVRNVIDSYHGISVTDRYRYMENLKDSKVQAWIKGQSDYAASVLGQIPRRAALLELIKTLDSGAPFNIFDIRYQPDGSYFYRKKLAEDNISKLYLRDGKTGKEKLLIDPEKLTSPDGKHYSLDFFQPSPNGKYVAYGISKGGSEQSVLHILNVVTGQDLEDTIDRIETAYALPSWLPDGRGFFYSRRRRLPVDAPATEGFKKTGAYLHLLGTNPEKDQSVFAMDLSPAVEMQEVDFPSIVLTQGSNYAIGMINHGDAGELTLYAAPQKTLGKPNTPWKKICDVEDAVEGFAVHNDTIYLKTYKNTPRFEIVRTSLENPNFLDAKVVVPAGEVVINYLTVAKDALYVDLLDGGIERILRVPFDKNDKPERLELPYRAAGYVVSASPRVEGVVVSSSFWTKGRVLYEYEPRRRKIIDTRLQPKGKFDDVPGYESVEVKVRSHDGVMVPLSIIHKRGLKLDGLNPTLLTGYSSYGQSMLPFFDPTNLAWLERGGVLAFAHARGGGEYGKEWHLAGQKQNKPNTWKDFIACAEYLIAKKYTSPLRLAGEGSSAGGILIGRAITERPDLFAAAIIGVGSLDMLRSETTTNGVPNIQEFGSVKTKDGFNALYGMSAFHHVKDGVKYPAVLLIHGINDMRVEPWFSAKMAARLQAATSSGKPILLRVDYDAGHGISPTKKQYQAEIADKWLFLLWQLGVKDFQKTGP